MTRAWVRWPLLQAVRLQRSKAGPTIKRKGEPGYWHVESGFDKGRTICGYFIPSDAETTTDPERIEMCQKCAAITGTNRL
jgi:hypothetical protein